MNSNQPNDNAEWVTVRSKNTIKKETKEVVEKEIAEREAKKKAEAKVKAKNQAKIKAKKANKAKRKACIKNQTQLFSATNTPTNTENLAATPTVTVTPISVEPIRIVRSAFLLEIPENEDVPTTEGLITSSDSEADDFEARLKMRHNPGATEITYGYSASVDAEQKSHESQGKIGYAFKTHFEKNSGLSALFGKKGNC